MLLWFADDLDRRLYPMAGALRQVAQEVAELDVDAVEEGEDRCPCGAERAIRRAQRTKRTTLAEPDDELLVRMLEEVREAVRAYEAAAGDYVVRGVPSDIFF